MNYLCDEIIKGGFVKLVEDEYYDKRLSSMQYSKMKRIKFNNYEMDELQEHADEISFNIGKVYRQVRDRTKKDYKQARQTLSRKLNNTCKQE